MACLLTLHGQFCAKAFSVVHSKLPRNQSGETSRCPARIGPLMMTAERAEERTVHCGCGTCQEWPACEVRAARSLPAAVGVQAPSCLRARVQALVPALPGACASPAWRNERRLAEQRLASHAAGASLPAIRRACTVQVARPASSGAPVWASGAAAPRMLRGLRRAPHPAAPSMELHGADHGICQHALCVAPLAIHGLLEQLVARQSAPEAAPAARAHALRQHAQPAALGGGPAAAWRAAATAPTQSARGLNAHVGVTLRIVQLRAGLQGLPGARCAPRRGLPQPLPGGRGLVV